MDSDFLKTLFPLGELARNKDNSIHNYILVWIQMQLQLLDWKHLGNALNDWIPDLDAILCPVCGTSDWEVTDGKVRTREQKIISWGIIRCKAPYCRYEFPPAVKQKEFDVFEND